MNPSETPKLPANAYLLDGIVRVCMCCHPHDSIFRLHPEWRELGLTVSHGLCPECKDRMMADLEKHLVGPDAGNPSSGSPSPGRRSAFRSDPFSRRLAA